jgi:Bacterial Ig domain
MKLLRPNVVRLVLTGLVCAFLAAFAYAATPSSGTVSQSNPTVTWTGQIPVPPAAGSSSCGGPNNTGCDNFKLTIVPPDATFGPYVVVVKTLSKNSDDWDLEVYDSNGKLVGSSGNGAGTPVNPEVETVTLTNPPAGTYTVSAVPFAVTMSYSGSASLQHLTPTALGGNGTEPLSYAVYPNPNGVSAGEPSCGVDWKTKNVMYQAGLTTLQVSFSDCTSPATASWKDVSFLTTSLASLDSILFTDRFTNRTIVAQLTGQDSLSAFSDNDGGANGGGITGRQPGDWTPSQGGGIPSGVDHETVGGGPFHSPLIGTVYADAVYYCSQDIAAAFCALSVDGGATYGAGVPTWTMSDCGGIHGHVKVSPADGTVYVPNKSCNGLQAVAVSENNGVTWTVRRVPGISSGIWDPSVGISTDGTVYFGADDGSSLPLIAVSHDKGQTWSSPVNVGAFAAPQQTGESQGVKQTAFPEVVAGDPTRAAFAFLGSTTSAGGGGGDDPNWPGIWHLYVAHTYDGGSTYTTIDVTPNDPVQRNATICAGGTTGCSNGTRNLLDFNDASVDEDGRAVIAYADGCIGGCVAKGSNSFTALSTIARQVNGRRLFAASDVVSVPAAPLVQASIDCTSSRTIHISWSTPDDHGSTILRYYIYRSTDGGATFTIIATEPFGTNEYTDMISSGQSVQYKVTAVNAFGESAVCSAITPTLPPNCGSGNPCKVPGMTVLTDAVGDATDMQPGHDIVQLSIAQPTSLGPGKIMFILKMVSLQNVPPDTTWPILFHSPGGVGGDFWVRMSNVVTPSNPTGAIKFAYGSGAVYTALNPTDNPGTSADPASGFNADGTITIIIPLSAIGSPIVGQQLTQFLVRISVEAAAGSVTPDNMPDTTTRAGSYTIADCTCKPPTANPDSANTTENRPVVINVVANDTDGGFPPITVTGVTQPTNGTATNNGDGTVTYAANHNFVGTDSFTYTIRNDCGKTATGNVTVTVKPCTRPTANPDSATTGKNHAVVINVVANDTDGGFPPLTVTSVTQPSHGTATPNDNGTVTYTPNNNFTGTDSFTYTIQNNCGATATAKVTVNVRAESDDEDEGEGDDNEGDSAKFDDHQNNPSDSSATYNDSAKQTSMQSVGPVRGISYNGLCVSFSGDALVNGKSGYTFTFSACDLSTLGTGIGTFSVNLAGPGGFVYTKSAAMTSGYVQIHPH